MMIDGINNAMLQATCMISQASIGRANQPPAAAAAVAPLVPNATTGGGGDTISPLYAHLASAKRRPTGLMRWIGMKG